MAISLSGRLAGPRRAEGAAEKQTWVIWLRPSRWPWPRSSATRPTFVNLKSIPPDSDQMQLGIDQFFFPLSLFLVSFISSSSPPGRTDDGVH